MIVRQDSSASFRQGSELGDEWDLMQLTHTSAPYVEPLNHELVFCQERHKIMEGSGDGSPQSSMCMVKAAELFPKPILEKEEEKLTVRFTELAGESIRYLGQTDDGILALSNYRLFLQKNSTAAEVSVPLGLIESTQVRELFHLIVNCKDASTVRCSFATSEQCGEWHRRISLSIGVPETLEALFAFPFHAWASESPTLNQDNEWAGRLQRVGSFEDEFRREAERLQFDLQGAWRISQANAEFKLCPSYPRLLLVPACISDDTLQNVASFRSSRRIPAVVWRHQRTGAVIARCSQPEVGWLGWRNSKDEQLLKALSDACSFDRGTQDRASDVTRRTRTQTDSSEASSDGSPPRSPEGSHEEVEMDEPKKILIVDARSYTSAVTNRARGGGCECAEYYPSAEIQFMSLGNIHVIRKSFHALRQLCASQADIPNWLGLLERTLWLQHLSGLLAASMVVCHAIERSGRPVLVHCSDGWDRTPQIVATAQLCLDPYYRTIEGFRVLVEREWLSFGHKFADRCGHGPGSDETNERCPVFLQWLDCVHQIHRQFPCSFEFDMGYLIKLAQHSHSCLFGTFLCNTVKERQENSVPDRTFSVWPFLSGPIYKNHLYVPNRERVLWPAHNVRDLRLWTEVYLGSWGGHNQQSASESVDYPAASVSAVGPNVASAVVAVGIRSVGTGVEKPTGSIVVGGSASVNGVGGIGVKSSAASASATSPEQNGSMTKTRSYSDIKEATSGGIMTRRSSDPSMIVDSSVLDRKSKSVGLNLSQEESSLDSNISSDRETSPDLPSIDGHLLDREAIASSFIQQATEKLQSLTQELNQSDEELEQTIRNQRMLADSSPLCGVASAVGGDSEDTFRSAHKPSSASSSLFPNGLTGGVDSLAVAAAATLILTATTNVRPSFTTTSIGEESIGRYRFQPIVPELPTVVPPAPAASLNHSHYTSTMAPVINVNQHHGKQQHQLVTWPDTIDENTSRIIKIESYQPTNSAGKDIPDGGGGDEGFGEGLDLGRGINRAVVGRPIMTNDDMMMESVDLTIRGTDDSSFGGDTLLTDSPNQLESPLPTARSLSPNLWHGSIETSTDTLVPMDQYPPSLGTSVLGSQQECLQNLPQVGLSCGQSNLSDAASTETPRRTNRKGSGEATIDDVGSISLAVVNSDSSQLGLVNGKGSVTAPRDVLRNTGLASDHYATKTQTGDSNGCDFTSNSQDYHRNLSNQPTLTLISDSQLPKDRTDSRYHHQHPPESMLETDRGGCRSGLAIQHAQSNISSNASCNKLKANGTSLSSGCTAVSANANPLLSSMMLMDESIIIQPQFQHLEINGKHPVSGSAPCEAVATSTIVPLKERRRRNSSNSKHDLMSPCKPTNGSISPSATHSRFSTPGARSLPLTPPSAPFAADRPPVATFSCPDGLAHALSEQNLRLQQIVYEHRLREEALQRELYATRLALLKKFCQHCCSSSAQQQYGNEDPVPVSLSITSVATFTATAYAMARDSRIDDRRKPPRSSHGSRSSSGSTSTITTASLGTTATATPVCQCDPHGVWDPAEMFSPSLLPPEESTKPALLRAPPVEHHPLLIFSDEEDDCSISSRCDGAGPESDQEQEERLLCQEMLKHESRLAHNAVVCRTIRRFLERTRHKRMTCPVVAAPAVELSKSCALPALLLEESVNEHYAYGGGSDSDCNYSGDKSDGDEKYVAREWTMRRLARARGGGHHREGRRELNIDSSSSSEDEGDGGGGGGGEGGDSDEEENGDVDDAELSSQLMVDSMNENASNCSWEAVDDRSAPSSGANSSQQMQYSSSGVGGSNSVLWVPDHAVTRCTTCQTEFWLGRRKHHCRSCGQIFCAECSEFTAHLPDERLYQPVRLCGPCYQRISTATSTSGASVPSTSTHGNIAQQHVNAAPSMLAANGSTSTTNEDSSAFLYRSNATATATAIMRDRITSMSQMQTLLAAECSSEAPRASESCCKQNVTAAATN